MRRKLIGNPILHYPSYNLHYNSSWRYYQTKTDTQLRCKYLYIFKCQLSKERELSTSKYFLITWELHICFTNSLMWSWYQQNRLKHKKWHHSDDTWNTTEQTNSLKMHMYYIHIHVYFFFSWIISIFTSSMIDTTESSQIIS